MPQFASDEKWLPVVGREDTYEVSDLGRVRSIDRVVLRSDGKRRPMPGVTLKPFRHPKGYLYVTFHRPRCNRPVHQLVLEAFVGLRSEGLETRHLNGDPSDNRLSNICWGTGSENQLDNVRLGTHKSKMLDGRCKRGHLVAGPNLAPYALRRGHRVCYSCHKAIARTVGYPNREHATQTIADLHYAEIMAQAS